MSILVLLELKWNTFSIWHFMNLCIVLFQQNQAPERHQKIYFTKSLCGKNVFNCTISTGQPRHKMQKDGQPLNL